MKRPDGRSPEPDNPIGSAPAPAHRSDPDGFSTGDSRLRQVVPKRSCRYGFDDAQGYHLDNPSAVLTPGGG